MTLAAQPALAPIDWTRPWLAPLRDLGEPLARRAGEHGTVAALNDAARSASVALAAGPLRFVAQSALPAGVAYETFIARTASVPTRDNLHDFFNGLVWLAHPALKRRLNELQAQQLALPATGLAVGGRRGAVRDTLTLFDENAAWWQAPSVLVDALHRRDWRALFVTHRAAWREARLTLFGHALIEKLTRPRKAITAHVWVVPKRIEPHAWLLDALVTPCMARRAHLPLPVLGVPGWWPENEDPDFYRDAAVFRAGAATTVRYRSTAESPGAMRTSAFADALATNKKNGDPQVAVSIDIPAREAPAGAITSSERSGLRQPGSCPWTSRRPWCRP